MIDQRAFTISDRLAREREGFRYITNMTQPRQRLLTGVAAVCLGRLVQDRCGDSEGGAMMMGESIDHATSPYVGMEGAGNHCLAAVIRPEKSGVK